MKQKLITERLDSEGADLNIFPPIDVVSYNELRSCADLYRLIKDKSMILTPEYQREYVWNNDQASLFIDSLMKQMPIPSICVSYDFKTGERIVVDGRQRLTALFLFMEGKLRVSEIASIDTTLRGSDYDTLKEKNLAGAKRIVESVLPINVIRHDSSTAAHRLYIYVIFKRLNSGSTPLNNQEIRNAVYHGGFNDFLKQMSMNSCWISAMIRSKVKIATELKLEETIIQAKDESDEDDTDLMPDEDVSQLAQQIALSKSRYKDRESILRVTIFALELDGYEGKYSEFINAFMQKQCEAEKENKECFSHFLAQLSSAFGSALKITNLILDTVSIGKRKVSHHVIEAILTASLKLSMSEELKPINDSAAISRAYEIFIGNDYFNTHNISQGVYQKSKVRGRIDVALTLIENVTTK